MKLKFVTIENKTIGIDELVDSKVAGKILGLKPRTVRNMGNRKELSIYKIGIKTNRFLVRDLLTYCEERRQEISDV